MNSSEGQSAVSPFSSITEGSGSSKARSILIDLERDSLDKIRFNRELMELFDPDCLINHLDGSGGIISRAKYTTGKEIKESIEDSMRH